MFSFRFLTDFGASSEAWSTLSVLFPFSTLAGDRLLAGSAATGTLHLLSLTQYTVDLLACRLLPDPWATYMLNDAALVTLDGQIRLYSASHTGNWIDVQAINPVAATLTALAPIAQVGGVAMAVSTLAPLQLAGQTYLAIAAHDRGTLEILHLSTSDAPRLVDRAVEGPKAILDGVSDMVKDLFLIAASGRRDGLSSFCLHADGSLELADRDHERRALGAGARCAGGG